MDEDHRVRALVAEAARTNGIGLTDTDEEWSVRGIALAPFPARLRLDADQRLLWHDVVAAEVVPPVAVEAVVERIDLPRPEVRLMVGEARWMIAISYPLPFEHATEREVVGLLSAGALYAAVLARDLDGHLGKRWRSMLEQHGFVPGVGFPHDARDLLRRGSVVAWPDIGQ
jgi:hypothetical protein